MRQAPGADCLYAARVELICPSRSSCSEMTFANANDVQQLLLSGMLVLPQNNRSKQMEADMKELSERERNIQEIVNMLCDVNDRHVAEIKSAVEEYVATRIARRELNRFRDGSGPR